VKDRLYKNRYGRLFVAGRWDKSGKNLLTFFVDFGYAERRTDAFDIAIRGRHNYLAGEDSIHGT
jgi:hypothetical protein